MADLTDEEDKELKRTTDEGAQDGDAPAEGGLGIRRDFSVIHSKQLKKNHLFLGPARFVNVSFSLLLALRVFPPCLPDPPPFFLPFFFFAFFFDRYCVNCRADSFGVSPFSHPGTASAPLIASSLIPAMLQFFIWSPLIDISTTQHRNQTSLSLGIDMSIIV